MRRRRRSRPTVSRSRRRPRSIASGRFSASRSRCCRASTSAAMRPMPRPRSATAPRCSAATIWRSPAGCRSSVACAEVTGLLSDVLTAADAMGQPGAPGDLKLLQYPRDAAARWGALPPAPGQDLRGVVAVVAHAPAALAALGAADTLAGLFVDEWSESIPTDRRDHRARFPFRRARCPPAAMHPACGAGRSGRRELDARRAGGRGQRGDGAGAPARSAAAGPDGPRIGAARHLPVQQFPARTCRRSTSRSCSTRTSRCYALRMVRTVIRAS